MTTQRDNFDHQPTIDSQVTLRNSYIPCAVSAILNLAMLATIAWMHPQYLENYQYNNNPDARHYVILGDNIIQRHVFSRCESPPYVADSLRTPVYPGFAGIMHQAAGPIGIYVLQALCHVISCAILYKLVAELFGHSAGFWASIFLAFDLTLTVSNFEAMSEPLYLLLNLAGLACLIPPLIEPRNGSTARAAIGGAMLGLAALTRPTGLYVPIVVALITICSLVWNGNRRRTAIYGLVALATAAFPIGLWIARNWYVFSIPRLTTNDAIMLVYFFAAGGHQVEHGLTLEQAQKQISVEYQLPPPEITNNHWASDESVRATDIKLRRAFRLLLARRPAAIALSSFLGIAKASTSHNIDTYAHMTERKWMPPGLNAAIAGDHSALTRFAENPLDMMLLFSIELLHTVTSWVLGIVGLVIALACRTTRGSGLVVAVILSYFFVTLAIVGMEAYWRYRTPHMPLIYAFAGVAAAGISDWMNGCQRRLLNRKSHS